MTSPLVSNMTVQPVTPRLETQFQGRQSNNLQPRQFGTPLLNPLTQPRK